MSRETARIKDQLGKNPETFPILIADYDETLTVEEGPLKIEKNDIGNSFILGHLDNGVLGSPQLADNGSQVLLGEQNRSLTLQTVVNRNDLYTERFYHTLFNDTGVTTADWTGDGTLVFTSGEVAQSKIIAKDTRTFVQATITATASSGSTGDLAFQLSADGGSTFENVTQGSLHTFTTTGTEISFKITASGSVTLSRITVTYA